MSRGPASVRIERRVEWADTDASGHHHNTFPLRLCEAAEVVLLRRLGVPAEVHVGLPRVHVSIDYRRRLWAGDLVAVEIAVTAVGRTSVTYGFRVLGGEAVAAEGEVVAVYAPLDADGATPWPDAIRHALLEAGPQVGERLVDG